MLKQCIKDVQVHHCHAARTYLTCTADSLDITGDAYETPTLAFDALLDEVALLHVRKPVIIFLDSKDPQLATLIMREIQDNECQYEVINSLE